MERKIDERWIERWIGQRDRWIDREKDERQDRQRGQRAIDKDRQIDMMDRQGERQR